MSAVNNEFLSLPGDIATRVRDAVVRIKGLKLTLHTTAIQATKTIPCQICRGACCYTGIYHFTIVDLLAYLCDDQELFSPNFEGNRCPYLGHQGCLMPPEYRPYNCITFHCDNFEENLGPTKSEEMYRVEKRLRQAYRELEDVFNTRFFCGLFANYSRAYKSSGRILSPFT